MRTALVILALSAVAFPAFASEPLHLTPPLTREHAREIRRAPVMADLGTVPHPVHAPAVPVEASAPAAALVAEATAP